jgi:hypothetical protein
VIDKHGQPAVQAAANELLNSEGQGSETRWSLKPELHVHCRMLLGPMPSEWKDWWQNTDGSDRKGKLKKWPPHRKGFDNPPAKPAGEEMKLQTVPLRTLAGRLHASRRQARTLAGEEAKEAQAEVERIEAEYQRRGYVIPETPEQEQPKPRKRAGKWADRAPRARIRRTGPITPSGRYCSGGRYCTHCDLA